MRDNIASQRNQLVRQTVLDVYRNIQHKLHKAFETEGCSCNIYRAEQVALNEECDRLMAELKLSEPFRRREEVIKLVQEIDRAEHPNLNAEANMAAPFFRIWLFDKLVAGEEVPLSKEDDLAREFTREWYAGWRPAIRKEEV